MNNAEYNSNWKMSFELIKYENNLINHRTSATLTLQGLLYAGVGFCSSKILEENSIGHNEFILLSLIIVLISLVGFLSSFTFAHAIRAAMRQCRASSLWLINVTKDECSFFKKIFPYPPIVGRNPNKPASLYQNYYHKCEHNMKTNISSCKYNESCKKTVCKDYLEGIDNIKEASAQTHRLLDIISFTWAIIAIGVIAANIYKFLF